MAADPGEKVGIKALGGAVYLPRRRRRAFFLAFRRAASLLDTKWRRDLASLRTPSIWTILWKRRNRESSVSPSRLDTFNGIINQLAWVIYIGR
jgi:hypothetical protein